MDSNTLIRWMSREDTDAVSNIRLESAVGSKDLLKVLSSSSFILKVAEIDGQVSGFITYKNSKKRIRILELAVSSCFRRKGIASKLVGSILEKAKNSSKSVEVLIPEYNLAAQLLLKKCGLKSCEIIRSANECFYKFTSQNP